MVVVEHVVGVVGAGAVAGIWNWSRGGKGVPWRREGTVFLCMLPRVPVQQVSYTLARERAYFLQNGVGGAQGRCVVPTDWAPGGEGVGVTVVVAVNSTSVVVARAR